MLRLPHPEAAALLDPIKRDVIRIEQHTVADTALSYAVFRSEAHTPDLAFYDTDGTIYIPEDLVQFDQHYAHLIALHEHVEIQHKRAARPHAYAHRRALLVEFLAAKQIFSQPGQLECYLHWRIGGYPEAKRFDRAEVLAQLMHILAAERPRKGDLFHLIKAHPL
jgi:hypothetical protein